MTDWTKELEAAAEEWAAPGAMPERLLPASERTGKEFLCAAIREVRRLRDELADALEHEKDSCPCSWYKAGGIMRKPAPLDECTCGLKEALWGQKGDGA